MSSEFKISTSCGHGKGFHITFSNGYTVSVQWGVGNYCRNYSMDLNEAKAGTPASNTAETAVIHPNGEFLTYKGSVVQGHQTADDVAKTIADVSSWSKT